MSEAEDNIKRRKEEALYDLFESYEVIKSSELYSNHLREIDPNAVLISLAIFKLTNEIQNVVNELEDINASLDEASEKILKRL
jgi:hypothetical protein